MILYYYLILAGRLLSMSYTLVYYLLYASLSMLDPLFNTSQKMYTTLGFNYSGGLVSEREIELSGFFSGADYEY